MYSIDINFLRDRKLDSATSGTKIKQKATPMSERIPIFIGLGIGVALVAASGGALLFINNQKAITDQEIKELEGRITQLLGQNEEVKKLQAQIDMITKKTDSLVSVFDNIKPWSALLAEIGLVIPSKVQIQSIAQAEGKTVTITGIAETYDDVNDFVLTLKNSKFLNPENTALTTSSLIENPNNPTKEGEKQPNSAQNKTSGLAKNNPSIEFPPVVNYTITAELSDIPASKLINDLKLRGATGLVSRINILEQKGAIKP